jgi:hypothetical protein
VHLNCNVAAAFQTEIVYYHNSTSGYSHLKAEEIHAYSKLSSKILSVTCYPLYDMLVAAGLTKLDYLGLDVQGPELKILQTIPWDLVDFKVL